MGREWREELTASEDLGALEAGEPVQALEGREPAEALEGREPLVALEAGETVEVLEAREPLDTLEGSKARDFLEAGEDLESPRKAALRELHRLTRKNQRLRHRGRGRGGRDSHSGQGRILKALSLSPAMTQRDLGYILGISRQGLAETLGKLEDAELVQRKRAVEDRRVVVVELTDAGRAEAEDMAAQEDVLETLLGDFTDEEVDTLTGYLARLNLGLDGYLTEGEGEGCGERRRKGGRGKHHDNKRHGHKHHGQKHHGNEHRGQKHHGDKHPGDGRGKGHGRKGGRGGA